jgi:hypothetical protein
MLPRSAITLFIAAASIAVPASRGGAQSLEETLDEQRFLRGLCELQLPEVLRHYLATHPPKDELQAALHRIAEEQMLLLDRSLAPADRLVSVERLLSVRGRLIAEHHDDPRHALWLIDQASDILWHLLPSEACGVTALFGRPTPQQLERARDAARSMHEHALAARAAIGDDLARLEQQPGFADSPALRADHRRLAGEERDGRLAFVQGVASVLHAELNEDDDAARLALARRALDLLEPLGDTATGATAAAAWLYAGLALLRLGRFDAADEAFRSAAGTAADPVTTFMARLGGVRVRGESRGPEAGLEALDSIEHHYAAAADPLYAVLLADARVRFLHERASRGPEADRPRIMSDALLVYLRLLPDGALPASAATRAMIIARLGEAADASIALDALPPIVTVARAEQLARDEEAIPRALELFDLVLRRDDLDANTRGEAMFGSGRALHAAGRTVEAALRFTDLARTQPTHPYAERAMRAALALAESARSAAPLDASALAALSAAIDLLLSSYANLPEVDQWRYLAARLALAEGRFDDAARLFAEIPPDAPCWLDARLMAVRTAEAEADAASDPAERRRLLSDVPRAAEAARASIETGLTSATPPDRRAALEAYLRMLRLIAARARLGLDEPQAALELLQDLDRDSAASIDIVAETLRIRIEACRRLGRGDEARRGVERFLDAAPDRVIAVILPMLIAMIQEVESLIEARRDDIAAARARAELEPLAAMLSAWPPRASLEAHERLRLDAAMASAFRLAGRCDEALPLFEQLTTREPHRIEFIFGRGECLFTGGEAQLGEAMQLYRRIAAAGPGSGGRYFWLAQVRMLQILDRVGQNTQQIAPRIDWLRQLDPDLGGDRTRRELEALAAKHG